MPLRGCEPYWGTSRKHHRWSLSGKMALTRSHAPEDCGMRGSMALLSGIAGARILIQAAFLLSSVDLDKITKPLCVSRPSLMSHGHSTGILGGLQEIIWGLEHSKHSKYVTYTDKEEMENLGKSSRSQETCWVQTQRLEEAGRHGKLPGHTSGTFPWLYAHLFPDLLTLSLC